MYLKQTYDVKKFQGKHGTIEVRRWRDGGHCTCHAEKWQGDKRRCALIENDKLAIVWILQWINGEATNDDIQAIKDAIYQMDHSDWIIKDKSHERK